MKLLSSSAEQLIFFKPKVQNEGGKFLNGKTHHLKYFFEIIFKGW